MVTCIERNRVPSTLFFFASEEELPLRRTTGESTKEAIF
jgi:hypothetical protein